MLPTARRRAPARGLAVSLLAAALAFATPGTSNAQGTLRLGMTAADIPVSFGQPDNGFEGFRYMGLMVYDALVNWDLTAVDRPSGLVPGLAESWSPNADDPTKWTFKLRQGAKFHDGSEFNADAVLFNFDKLFKQDAPQYSARQASLVNFRIPAVKSWRKIDDYTVEFTLHAADSFFPYQICYIVMASPAGWEKAGKDWNEFAKSPSGTGPWRLTKLVPRERAEFEPFAGHWDKTRVPKLEKLITFPIPDPNARTNALLSGQVDWIEAPAPDAIPRIKQQGFEIVSNQYPHVWPYHLSFIEGSIWNDERVRKAANLAIDREGIVQLLGGYAVPAKGHVSPGDAWWGNPSFDIKYDPEAARKLMAEAGYGPDKPAKTKILISASGSGQMLPLAMNEYIQQNLKEIGIEVEFEVMEWQSLLDRWRAGSKSPDSAGGHAINVSYTTQDPYSSFTRFLRSDLHAPNGVNWGYYSNPEMDEMLKNASLAKTDAERDEWLGKVHTKEVNEALFIWVVHDVAPRAMSKKVRDFAQARNWFQSLTPVYMEQ